ncbi:uncharacterized protein LOC131858024 [Cryptomeria japonica]|uniref:uncharacterized protein LOC131858024 n=1 Tax=Cryptomeria japonica TaxID=3369 RepID=UPI0027DA65E5|nr:uncharacterized protein LOC131858024 [Cryptomeria japonica]
MGFRFYWSIESLSSAGHTHILTDTNYFMKWVEAVPVRKTTLEIVCNFLKENILTRFGLPWKIVIDNAPNFSSEELNIFYYDHGIILSHSLDYYLQGNGQAESSNKNLISIMQKLVAENAKDWHKRLYEALLEDKISPKRAIGMTPFELVYKVEAQLPLPLELSAARLQKVIED